MVEVVWSMPETIPSICPAISIAGCGLLPRAVSNVGGDGHDFLFPCLDTESSPARALVHGGVGRGDMGTSAASTAG